MRPSPPERGGAIFLERIPALWRRLGFRTHMALRSLARNLGRTLTGVASIALATAIILLTLSSYEAMNTLVDFQFNQVMRSDVAIGLREERSRAALHEARFLPGVTYAEPVLAVVCDLRHGIRSRRMAITGLTAEHRLTLPRRADGSLVDIPAHGLVMSRKLAEVLGARVGDSLAMTPVRGRRETVRVHLAAVADTFIGMDCYADLQYLSGVVGESLAINSLQLSVDPHHIEDLYAAIKNMPNAQGLSVTADARGNIEDTFVRTARFSYALMILFAGVIALGSTLNWARIEIGDRTREISTLRVLGYTPPQIAGIFFRQHATVSGLGILLGLPLGAAMLAAMAQAYNTELYRIPVVIKPRTLAIAAAIAMGFALLAQGVVMQLIRRLNWQEGVKVKE